MRKRSGEAIEMISDEEIIEMAKQAKFEDYGTSWIDNRLIAFARLIAAKQIEIDAGIAKANYRGVYDGDTCAAAIRSQK